MMKYKNEQLYAEILNEIKINPKITENELAMKYDVAERTIRRYFKDLKDKNKIALLKKGNLREWKIL